MSEIICNNCNQPCDVVSLDRGDTDQVVHGRKNLAHVSFCCKAEYRVPNLAEQMQRETLAELQIQRGRK